MVLLGINIHICYYVFTENSIVHLLLNPSSLAHQLGDPGQITLSSPFLSFSWLYSMSLIGLTVQISIFLSILVIYVTEVLWGLNELTFAKFLEKGHTYSKFKINNFKCGLLSSHLYRTKIWTRIMRNFVIKSSRLK